MGAHAYVITNLLRALAVPAANFTWSNGANTNRGFLNDNRLDQRFVVGATVASGVNVIIDFGGAVALTGFAVLNSNCAMQKTDATLKVEASSASDFGSDVNEAKAASTLYNSTVPRNRDHVVQFPGTFNKRYWRLTWTWTGNVTDFSIGELFAFSSKTSLSRRLVYGSGEGHDARVASVEMQYGQVRSIFLAGPIRGLELTWEDLTESQRNELQVMWQQSYCGAKPFLWIQSAESTATAAAADEQECIFGKLQEPRFRWTQPDFSIYTPDGLVLRSEGREAGA